MRELRGAACDVTLIDKKNHHVFQPLLYQVATAALSPANIAAPIRKIVSSQRNCSVVLGEVTGVDVGLRTVTAGGRVYPYDYLVLACGARHAYFGHDGWEAWAPGLKTIEDALEIRRRILLAFEAAELADDPGVRRAELTFVIVGGGPTGVELAGAIAEIAAKSIPRDFRRVDTRTARVVLVQSGDRVLEEYPEALSVRARRDLEALGVHVRTGTRATEVDRHGVTLLVRETGRHERLDARCVIWAAGVRASPLGAQLGAEVDRAGRVRVGADLSIEGHPEVFVIGDQMACADSATGRDVPGVAQGAIQSGAFVGKTIRAELAAQARGGAVPVRGVFRYRDLGSMATIGRARAVAAIGNRRFAGFIAWVLWSAVHVLALIGFRSKVMAMLEWAWLYLFWSRGARLITGEEAGDL